MLRSKRFISAHLLMIASTEKNSCSSLLPHFPIFATFFVATFQNTLYKRDLTLPPPIFSSSLCLHSLLFCIQALQCVSFVIWSFFSAFLWSQENCNMFR